MVHSSTPPRVPEGEQAEPTTKDGRTDAQIMASWSPYMQALYACQLAAMRAADWHRRLGNHDRADAWANLAGTPSNGLYRSNARGGAHLGFPDHPDVIALAALDALEQLERGNG